MFRKLVTHLPYSPGLLNQVGFYAKRLKQEEFTRRIGLIFTILALLVNINLSIFSPEASVLASPGNDVVIGGISGESAEDMQQKTIDAINASPYTAAILSYYGITESDIRSTRLGSLNTADENLRSVGRQAFGRGAETCHTNNGYSFCERNMHAAYSYRTLNVRALIGNRSNTGQSQSGDSWFALLESCGNVVIRINRNEDISISKSLTSDQESTVKKGDIVKFRIKLSSNNSNGAQLPVITDTLPAHTSYVDHSPKDMFDQVSVEGQKIILSSSKPSYGLGGNQSSYLTISAKIQDSAPAGSKLCNSVSAKSAGDSATSSTKPCVTVKSDKPVPTCTSLRLIGLGGTNKVRTFEVKADPDGAQMAAFIFDYGDGSQKETVLTSASTATATHTYQPGSYTVKVTGRTTIGDFGANPECQINIKVEKASTEPTVTCDYVKKISGFGRKHDGRIEVASTPENGAIVNSYSVDFGDGNKQTIANNSTNKITAYHKYEAPGKYKIKVTINAPNGDVTNPNNCLVYTRVVEPPSICIYDANLLENDPDCKPPAKCPYNKQILEEDEDCKPPKVCEYNSKLLAEDQACVKPLSCPYNEDLSLNDPNCVVIEVEKCQYNPGITADDENCIEPKRCEYNENILATSENCFEPKACEYDSNLLDSDDKCIEPLKCPYNEALLLEDEECGEAEIIRSKTVSNSTQSIDNAHATTASAGDTLVFKLITENIGSATAKDIVIRDDLADTLQYASLIDYDGGQLSADGKTVSWPSINVAPGEIIEKTITVKILSPIPDTPTSTSDPLAFDLKVENAYGNNVYIELPASTAKQIENTVTTLPKTGAGLNSFISTLMIGVVSYFYFRNRLVSKELSMIKNEFSGGSLA